VDESDIAAAVRVVLMLNKPRGLVTTREDEGGRATVYRCFAEAPLPWLAPLGRLDMASEGLLLFTNDPAWAAQLTNPATGPDKTYHVQIDRVPDEPLLTKLASGAHIEGDWLRFKSVHCMRSGLKNAWLEVVLDEGRNRQIRRVLEAWDVSVLRLVRVAIGGLVLGDLQKGHWRLLSEPEIAAL
jgi:23S rRNA pseudouridine2605 synthase